MEMENLKFRSVFKCFHQVLKIWENPKNRGNSGRFFCKFYVLEKKREKKINLALRFLLIF